MIISHPGSRIDRNRRRWVRRLLWLAAAVWFVHFAYVRITTPPGRMHAIESAIDPATDCLRGLFELIETLPDSPGSQAGNTQWYVSHWESIPLAAGLWDEWSPNSNADQQAATSYVSSERTQRVLEELVSYCRDRRELLMTAQYSRLRAVKPAMTSQGIPKLKEAVVALAFRTRWQHAQQGAVADALQSLHAAFLLSRIYTQCHAYEGSFERTFPTSFVQYETGCLAREQALDSALVRETLAELREIHPLSMTRVVGEYQQQDREIDLLLDRYYTCDADGDGWLVLSTDWPTTPYMPLPPRPGHNRAWNVFSPLFHDRATMREKLTASLAGLEDFDDLDFADMLRVLTTRGESSATASVLDGPLLKITRGIDTEILSSLVAYTAQQRALVVMLALSAHRFDYGSYPETLEQLVPEYLPEIPLELCSHQPFHYKPIGAENYDLRIDPDAGSFFIGLYWPVRCYGEGSYIPMRKPMSMLDILRP